MGGSDWGQSSVTLSPSALYSSETLFRQMMHLSSVLRGWWVEAAGGGVFAAATVSFVRKPGCNPRDLPLLSGVTESGLLGHHDTICGMGGEGNPLLASQARSRNPG